MYELSKAQYYMYNLYKNGIGQTTLLTGSLLIPRRIDIKELQRAANELFEKNSALRLRFIEKEGKVFQDAKPYEEKEFEVKYFNNKEELDKYGEVYGTLPLELDIVSEGEGYPESKWKSPTPSLSFVKNIVLHNIKTHSTMKKMGVLNKEKTCCEIILFEMPDGCGAFVKMYHVISDAWSMMLVANQFMSLLNGKDIESYDYKEYIDSENNYFLNDRYKRDVEFMDNEKSKCPKPTHIWPKPLTTLEGKRDTRVLDKQTTSLINEYCKANNTTPYIVFLSAISIYARHKLNSDTFYLGSVSLNRSNHREKNTIGMFTKGIPTVFEYNKDYSLKEWNYWIKNKSITAYKHSKARLDIGDGKIQPYDLWVSYQNATLDVDPSVICTQYYCNYSADIAIFSIEDRVSSGQYKLHFDHNLKVSDKETDELFKIVIDVIKKGISDDSIKISEL